MPSKFYEHFKSAIKSRHYEETTYASVDAFDSAYFRNPKGQEFRLIYAKRRLDTDALTAFFSRAPLPLLIVVDSDLIGDQTVQQGWLRALHALYYGRIYVWDGAGIIAVHLNHATGRLSDNGAIEIRALQFKVVDCLYSGFKGKYSIAMLGDANFWSGQQQQKTPPREKKAPEGEQFWRDYFKHNSSQYNDRSSQSKEDVFRDFREAFERNKRQYGADHGSAYQEQPYDTPFVKRTPTGDQWFTAIWADGTLDGAKRAFRALARQYHPDINKAPEATEIMKAINSAYEKVMRYHE